MIRIETVEVKEAGEIRLMVKKIIALKKEKLPVEYLKGFGIYYQNKRLLATPPYGSATLLKEEVIYTKAEFEKKLYSIKKAGENLARINREKKWRGEKTTYLI